MGERWIGTPCKEGGYSLFGGLWKEKEREKEEKGMGSGEPEQKLPLLERDTESKRARAQVGGSRINASLCGEGGACLLNRQGN